MEEEQFCKGCGKRLYVGGSVKYPGYCHSCATAGLVLLDNLPEPRNPKSRLSRGTIILKICPRCGYIVRPPDIFDRIGGNNMYEEVQECFKCKEPLVSKTIFVRWCKERLAFLAILLLLAMIGASASDGEPMNNPLVLIPILIVGSYIVAAFFFKVGRFREYVDIEEMTESDYDQRFSWKRFWREPLYMLVVVGAVVLIWLAVEFFKWLRSGGTKPFPR
jgi:hypothetical protein